MILFKFNFCIPDEDYDKFSNGLPFKNYTKFVLFNVKNSDETYDFANELKNEIINRSSDDVAVIGLYDEYEKIVANI